MDTLDRPATFRTRRGRFTVRSASMIPAVMRYAVALDDRPITLRARGAQFTVRSTSMIPSVLRYIAALESRECGANADGGGGFQPGNTCGKGDGGGGGASGSGAAKKLSDGEYAKQVADRLTKQGFTPDKHQKYIDFYQKRRDAQPEWFKSLSHAEDERVWFWIGSGYQEIRSEQKSGVSSSRRTEWESAIEKAPAVEGDFYRGLSGWNLTQSDIDQYKPGATVTLEADSSASKSFDYALEHSSKLTYVDPEDAGEAWTKERRPGLVLKFEGAQARDISGLKSVSMNQGDEPPKESSEKEVIIRRGGSYRVVSVEGRTVVLRPVK